MLDHLIDERLTHWVFEVWNPRVRVRLRVRLRLRLRLRVRVRLRVGVRVGVGVRVRVRVSAPEAGERRLRVARHARELRRAHHLGGGCWWGAGAVPWGRPERATAPRRVSLLHLRTYPEEGVRAMVLEGLGRAECDGGHHEHREAHHVWGGLGLGLGLYG